MLKDKRMIKLIDIERCALKCAEVTSGVEM